MEAFKFEDKLTFKVTLNQAHKILEKLKTEKGRISYASNELYEDLITYVVSRIDIMNVDHKILLKRLHSEFITRFKDQKLLVELEEDYLNVKEAIFEFNVKNGVSKKLSQIEAIKEKIRYYQLFKECLVCEKESIQMLQNAKEYFKNNSESEIESVKIKLLFFNYDEVKKILKDLNKRILDLEKEITLINASNEIEIKISKNVSELIGLG